MSGVGARVGVSGGRAREPHRLTLKYEWRSAWTLESIHDVSMTSMSSGALGASSGCRPTCHIREVPY
eukprot:6911205-Prymnesium_polylepis.3